MAVRLRRAAVRGPATRRRHGAGRSAFLATPAAVAAPRPSRRQTLALLIALLTVVGTVSAVSYLVRPDRARAFALVNGSIFLSDAVAPVAVDLASGRPTVRLVQAAQQVGATTTAELGVVPVQNGTMLLNRASGEFNMVASTGFVVKTTGGVPIAARPGSTGAIGLASGQNAYIVQTGTRGAAVYLVGESTVQTAGVVKGSVRPRASRSMSAAASTAPGASAVADGALWLLVGSGAARTVRSLTVPTGSAPGATLTSRDHGRVPAVSALEAASPAQSAAGQASATQSPDSGPATVGVASAAAIRVIDGSSTSVVRYTPIAGADTVLATSEAIGRLTYLIHGTNGWYQVSVAPDGRDLHGPTKLLGIATGADLAPPAMSLGSVYTVDRSSGQIYRIDPSGRTQAVTGYPLVRENGKVIEPGGFADAYVIARGARVIVNSPSHLDALVLFTDGSHAPLTIQKSTAVSVSAASGAEALTLSRHTASKPNSSTKTTPKQQAATPVNNAIDCQDTRQKPHIPSIVGAAPGSRSVGLSWTYPTPDPQDCLPSTYVVSVALVGDNAPSPPAAVRVQGQTSVNLAGLFPSTQYEVTVTAYINGQGTPSAARLVTTGPAGPAAPTDVSVVADDAGNWNVTWRSCGTSAQGCVPASSWTVIPQFCDGLGLSGAAAPITVPADPTTAVQPPAQLAGGDALLGRGVRFQVEGIGADNAVGTPSASTPCVYSWGRPDLAGISVSASTPPATTTQGTTSSTVTVRFADGAMHDLGGVGATLTYQLLGPGGAVQSTVGPTTATTADLTGLSPGVSYSVSVVATPPHHPAAAVTTAPVAIEAAIANWPTPTAGTSCSNDSFHTCTLSVSFGLGGAEVRGETFDLLDAQLTCASESIPLSRLADADGLVNVQPGQVLTFSVDRFTYSGNCTVSFDLGQNSGTATDPALFGSSDSPTATGTVTISQPSITTTQGDFTAQWNGSYSSPSIQISYSGRDELAALASNWDVVVSAGSTANCDATPDTSGPNSTVSIEPSCVSAGSPYTASISYTYLGQAQNFQITPTGNPPQPVQSGNVNVAAAWNTDATNPAVALSFSYSGYRADLQNLRWTETITSNGTTCASATTNPGSGDFAVPVNYATCPPVDANGKPNTFTVTVTYSDPTYGGTGTYSPPIAGSPPQ